jgi:hypothetical protein
MKVVMYTLSRGKDISTGVILICMFRSPPAITAVSPTIKLIHWQEIDRSLCFTPLVLILSLVLTSRVSLSFSFSIVLFVFVHCQPFEDEARLNNI